MEVTPLFSSPSTARITTRGIVRHQPLRAGRPGTSRLIGTGFGQVDALDLAGKAGVPARAVDRERLDDVLALAERQQARGRRRTAGRRPTRTRRCGCRAATCEHRSVVMAVADARRIAGEIGVAIGIGGADSRRLVGDVPDTVGAVDGVHVDRGGGIGEVDLDRLAVVGVVDQLGPARVVESPSRRTSAGPRGSGTPGVRRVRTGVAEPVLQLLHAGARRQQPVTGLGVEPGQRHPRLRVVPAVAAVGRARATARCGVRGRTRSTLNDSVVSSERLPSRSTAAAW